MGEDTAGKDSWEVGGYGCQAAMPLTPCRYSLGALESEMMAAPVGPSPGLGPLGPGLDLFLHSFPSDLFILQGSRLSVNNEPV